jgi:radical SAM-linked protein
LQRLRFTYGRGEAVKYISHLDLMRFWDRAFRRAHLPLAMSQGFHPHPRISLASPLPVAVTSEAELMDVYLDEPLGVDDALQRLREQMVPGLEVVAVEPIDEELPSLQALVRFSEYRVTVETSLGNEAVEKAIRLLLAKESIPWEHSRDGDIREYDLRPLVNGLWLETAGGGTAVLGMRLQTDGKASGRPEQVTRALGFDEPPLQIHRTRLVLERALPVPAAVIAQRKAGRAANQRQRERG